MAFVLIAGSCMGTATAFSSPWPTLSVAIILLAIGIAAIVGKIGSTWTLRWPISVGLSTASFYLSVVATGVLVHEDLEAEDRKRDAAAEAVRESERLASLRKGARRRIERARQHLAGAEEAVAKLNPRPTALAAQELAPLKELDPPVEGYPEVSAQLHRLNDRMNRTGAERHLARAEDLADEGSWREARDSLAEARPYVAALGDAGAKLRDRQSSVQARGASFWAALDAIDNARAAISTKHADAIDAERAYDGALAQLNSLDDDGLKTVGRSVRSLRTRLERVRKRNHRRATRLRKQQAERVAQLAACGTPPTLSPWDGGLIRGEFYLKRRAHDPSSIDVEHCSPPQLARDTNRCWLSTCDVLGRNGFGAMVRNRMEFEVRAGRVVLAR